MIKMAVGELDDGEGSGVTKEDVDRFVKQKNGDLPVAHERFLSSYMEKVCGKAEVLIIGGGKYVFPGVSMNHEERLMEMRRAEMWRGEVGEGFEACGGSEECLDIEDGVMEMKMEQVVEGEVYGLREVVMEVEKLECDGSKKGKVHRGRGRPKRKKIGEINHEALMVELKSDQVLLGEELKEELAFSGNEKTTVRRKPGRPKKIHNVNHEARMVELKSDQVVLGEELKEELACGGNEKTTVRRGPGRPKKIHNVNHEERKMELKSEQVQLGEQELGKEFEGLGGSEKATVRRGRGRPNRIDKMSNVAQKVQLGSELIQPRETGQGSGDVGKESEDFKCGGSRKSTLRRRRGTPRKTQNVPSGSDEDSACGGRRTTRGRGKPRKSLKESSGSDEELLLGGSKKNTARGGRGKPWKKVS